MRQALLFSPPAVAGLSQRDAVITVAEERSLLVDFQTLPFKPFRFQGWLGKRQTISYGWRYDFDGGRFCEASPLPSFLSHLRDTVAGFAQLPPADLLQALVTRYDVGAGIGWHRDRPEFEHVIGVSFGNVATMRLRKRSDGKYRRTSFEMSPRSAYHLTGEVRHEWEHSISEMSEPRWSVTFRSLSERGRALSDGAFMAS